MIIFDQNYPDIMTTEEACNFLNISKSTCLNLLKSGQLKGFKINNSRSWRICKPMLIQYVQSATTNKYKYSNLNHKNTPKT